MCLVLWLESKFWCFSPLLQIFLGDRRSCDAWKRCIIRKCKNARRCSLGTDNYIFISSMNCVTKVYRILCFHAHEIISRDHIYKHFIYFGCQGLVKLNLAFTVASTMDRICLAGKRRSGADGRRKWCARETLKNRWGVSVRSRTEWVVSSIM